MFLVLQAQVGLGILSLPHDVQQIAKGGGWISTLFAGFIVQLIILLLWALCRLFPFDIIYQFVPKILGKLLGYPLCFVYIAFFLFTNVIVLIRFADIIAKWALPETPKWVILLLILAVSIYLAKEKLRTIARFYVTSCFLIGLLVLLTFTGYLDVHFTYILPIMEAGWINILKGAKESIVPFLGYEIILVAYPFVEGRASGKLKAISLANLLVTLLYTFIVFTSLIIFSPEELPLIPEPTLYMLKVFSFYVLERIDLIFLSIWVILCITSIVSYLYLATVGFGKFFHKGEHKKAVLYAGLICFILALFPQDQGTMQFWDELFEILFYLLIIAVPFVLLIIAYLKRTIQGKSL